MDRMDSGTDGGISAVPVTFPAAEDWILHGTLYENVKAEKNAPVVLISGAAGAPHIFYNAFAHHLCKMGAAAVLTYDYRGMAASSGDVKQWDRLRMFHWAQHDFTAATAYLKDRFLGHPLMGVGHSYGGQALGLSGQAHKFERYATVATMSGYWRGLDTPYSVWFKTQIFGRLVAKTLGHIPKVFGLGGVFPGKIFLDWAKWIRSPNYWFDSDDVPGLDNFKHVTLPYLSIHVSDDLWGTVRAIGSFMAHYENADFRQITVSPGKSGKIGHIGYFRKVHEAEHWPHITNFLFEKP